MQGMELSPPLNLGVVSIEKGALGLPSTKVPNLVVFYGISTIVGY